MNMGLFFYGQFLQILNTDTEFLINWLILTI